MTYLFAFLLLVTNTVYAHDGAHGPEELIAPNGGILRQSTHLFAELLRDESLSKLYLYTHESIDSDRKPLSLSQIKISKKTKLTDPRKKRNIEFQLKPKGDHFELQFSPTGASRYEFSLVLEYKGKEEKAVLWQIEP